MAGQSALHALADHRQSAARALTPPRQWRRCSERLVALNAKRAAQATGTIRWLRRVPGARDVGRYGHAGQALDVVTEEEADGAAAPLAAAPVVVKRPWPTGLPEQIKAVAELLATTPQPLALADIEARRAAGAGASGCR